MVTLIVNPGSSSKKYSLCADGRSVFTVRFEQTAQGYGRCVTVRGEQKTCDETNEHMYQEALHEVLTQAKAAGVLSSMGDIANVGVRVVAPGHKFSEHREIDTQYVHDLTVAKRVAPIHAGPILDEIAAVQKILSHAKLYAVSDSAFHQTIPSHRTAYSLKGTAERGIRRYGYHGLSVSAVLRRVPEMVADELSRVVVAHIGSGVSVTAVKDGVSVDTTMGYTPASGLVMNTRAGDIDPGALIAFMESEGLHGETAQEYLQTQGGLFGLTGCKDLRQVLLRAGQKIPEAEDALRVFLEDIQKSIASAAVSLGGADALVLTATAMERNPELRASLIKGLAPLGFFVNEVLNERVSSTPHTISDPDTSIPIMVVPTDEMGEMDRVVSTLAQ